MSLESGTALSHYEILETIGKGGMGEVYKATDTRLDRTVAIKVLPGHLSANTELRARFEREAKAIAALNHSRICTLHDFDTLDGVDFLVMEYIEGETLLERLKKGALPLDKALEYAIQIAEGLDNAHRAGIVHRDLKPGNIMSTKTGIKLLDFGLAKLVARGSVSESSDVPTEHRDLTKEHAILGTLQYMAPEQLEGENVGVYTDIFAFGAVIYEMVTGKKAFEGKSQASLISAIMSAEPSPMSELIPLSPPSLQRVVKSCLAKEPEQRRQSAHDLMLELLWVAEGGADTRVSEPRSRLGRLGWAAVLLTAGVIAAAVSFWSSTPAAEFLAIRFPVELSPREAPPGLAPPGRVVALSPDGTRLAYLAWPSRLLYLRELDGLEATPVSGSEGARDPFFSPDGEWVAFFSGGQLKKVSVHGGTPVVLCAASNPRGGSWGDDDTIVFTPTPLDGLFRVPASGGTPEELTVRAEGERAHWRPHYLPKARALLFLSQPSDATGWENTAVEVLSLATGERKVVLEGGIDPRYLSTGHLLFVRDGGLYAVPFDLDRLSTTGSPVPVLQGVFSSDFPTLGVAQFTVSAEGTLVYLTGAAQSSRLVWVDREGTVSPLSEQEGHYSTPRLSPDGRRLALTRDDDIWIYEMARDVMTRLTFSPEFDGFPVWSPDGERLAFTSARNGKLNIFWKRADGTGDAERLTQAEADQIASGWSPDGRVIIYGEPDPEDDWDIWVLPLDEEREPRLFFESPFDEFRPRFSPDGRWVAYTGAESGQREIYVRPYPGPGGKWQISTEGGEFPMWARDGQELFYRQGNKMVVVSYRVESESFQAGRPRELFERGVSQFFGDVDIAPDGKRFLMLQPSQERASQVILVTHWFDELERLMPRE